MIDRQTDRASPTMLYCKKTYYWENIIKSNYKLLMFALKLYNSKEMFGLMTPKRWKTVWTVRLFQTPSQDR